MESTDTHQQPPATSPISSTYSLGVLSDRERALIRILSIANRRSLDPAPMVLALAEEFPGSYAERLEELSGKLIDGVSILDSISLTPRLLDPSHLVALRLADQAGKLPECMMPSWQRKLLVATMRIPKPELVLNSYGC